MAIITPLYGHTSQDTAYLVEDYPYGFTLRTQIKYWVEYKKNKGYRFVSQTLNPKNGVWNKPKPSTYAEFAGEMYLDEKGYVQCARLGVNSEDSKIKEFVDAFPESEFSKKTVKVLALKKIVYLKNCLADNIFFTINGVKQPWTEADRERHQKELTFWEGMK